MEEDPSSNLRCIANMMGFYERRFTGEGEGSGLGSESTFSG